MLDPLDVRLVNALVRDGRATLRSLAADGDVSISTASSHLRALEDRGVIRGYVPRIDYAALGYDVCAVVQVKVNATALPEITDWLVDHDQLTCVYEVTGHYDVVLVGRFEDVSDVHRHVTRLLSDPDVTDVHTSVVLGTAKEGGPFELPVEDG